MSDLKLFIIGGSKGESIIVKTPDDKWGVVDCYTPDVSDKSKNVCWQLLKNKQVTGTDVKELEFICMTHPHDDHYMGMSNLFEDFTVRRFWRFGGLNPNDMERVLGIVSAQANVSVDNDQQKSSIEFKRVFDDVKARNVVEEECVIKRLLRDAGDYQIWAIAPPSEHVTKYKEEILGRVGRLSIKELRKLKHNMISAALLIRFGKTRIVLAGDVEKPAWGFIVPELQENQFSLDCHAVKVSHHGSATGYTDDLWDMFCANCQPHAIITPFFKHRLPKPECVDHIFSRTPNVYTASENSMVGGTFEFNSGTNLEIQFLHRNFWTSYFTGSTQRSGVCALTFNDGGMLTEHVGLMGDAARVRSKTSKASP